MSATWSTSEVARLLVADPDDRELATVQNWLYRRFPKPTGTGSPRRWSRPEVITAVVLHSLCDEITLTTNKPPLPFHVETATRVGEVTRFQHGWLILDPLEGTISVADDEAQAMALRRRHRITLATVLCVDDLLAPVWRQHIERLAGAVR